MPAFVCRHVNNQAGLLFGLTDTYTFASNLLSITTIDAGLINVPPTPTGTLPTATHRRTPTVTRTPTITPTATPIGTPPAGYNDRRYLPFLRR